MGCDLPCWDANTLEVLGIANMLSLIRSVIDSLAELLPFGLTGAALLHACICPLLNVASRRQEFQRPQSSDVSRAHV